MELNLHTWCGYLRFLIQNHLLQAASMFKGPVPPIVPFSLGSLGFMTPFRILNVPVNIVVSSNFILVLCMIINFAKMVRWLMGQNGAGLKQFVFKYGSQYVCYKLIINNYSNF